METKNMIIEDTFVLEVVFEEIEMVPPGQSRFS
jgi:hypothetical protein